MLRIVATIELALILGEPFVPLSHVLPLGGSHVTQVGILFGTVVVFLEIYEGARSAVLYVSKKVTFRR
jgi:hypothetical protein